MSEKVNKNSNHSSSNHMFSPVSCPECGEDKTDYYYREKFQHLPLETWRKASHKGISIGCRIESVSNNYSKQTLHECYECLTCGHRWEKIIGWEN